MEYGHNFNRFYFNIHTYIPLVSETEAKIKGNYNIIVSSKSK